MKERTHSQRKRYQTEDLKQRKGPTHKESGTKRLKNEGRTHSQRQGGPIYESKGVELYTS